MSYPDFDGHYAMGRPKVKEEEELTSEPMPFSGQPGSHEVAFDQGYGGPSVESKEGEKEPSRPPLFHHDHV